METNTIQTQIKKGYSFLRELCAFNADFHAFTPRINPITNRVAYIINQLEKFNIPFQVDKFQPIVGTPDAVEDKVAFVNVYINIEGVDNTKTTVYMAHHDVANKASENCQDNTASIANLLDLAMRLSVEKPANNVLIAFVDAEEIVKMPICGAKRLAQKIKANEFGELKYIFNLELTANGRNYWMSYHTDPNVPQNESANRLREVLPTVDRVRTPYSDSFVMEAEGLPCVCMGSLDDQNIAWAKQGGGCLTWTVCHAMSDTFDAQANEADMDLFVTFLQSIV